MGHAEVVHPVPSPANDSRLMAAQRVPVPAERPYRETLGANLKETFFPDDPFRQFRGKPLGRRVMLGFQYLFPILDWGSRYTFSDFRADLIAGITIASLAIPQGISYAKLASLPPIIGLYSSFVPPLVYALMGSSKDMAVGTMAVGSLLMASMLQQEVPDSNSPIFIHLAFTATFFAGIFQASLGLLRWTLYNGSRVIKFLS